MNDEIKEILIKDFNEILVKEFCTDWKEKRLYIELLVNSTPFSNLLDYITNLQQENERLKDQNINEILKKDLEICAKQYKKSDEKLEKYKSRIEKAVAYIKEQYKWIEESDERWQPVLDNKKILNILKGEDND